MARGNLRGRTARNRPAATTRRASRPIRIGLRGTSARVRAMSKRFTKLNRRPRNTVTGLVNVATGASGSSSFKVYNRGNRMVRAQELVTENCQFSTNGALSISAKSGFQNNWSTSYFNRVDINNLFNYVQVLSQSTVAQLGAPTRIILEKVAVNYQFANTGVSACHLDIYDCSTIRDSTSYSWQLGASPTFSSTGLSPSDSWGIGMSQQFSGSPTGDENKQLMCRPNDSALFRQFFKIKNTKRLMLAAGSYHEHRINIKLSKSISSEMLANYVVGGVGNPNGLWALRGTTYHTLWNTYGAPASSLDGTVVSTAPSKIDAVYQMVYTFSYVLGNQKVTWQTDNLSSFAIGQQQVSTQNYIQPTAFA